jgi:chromosome partitioning protein
MTMLTLANSKGGGGKTTIAVCLSAEPKRRGKEVVMLDADPQQSLTTWHSNDGLLGKLPLHNDSSEKAAKWGVEASKKSIIIVDTAGFASTTLTAILKISDVVLIPCRAIALEARGVLASHAMVRSINTNDIAVGAVLNGAT